MKKVRFICILSMIFMAISACTEPVEKPDTNPETPDVPENPDQKPETPENPDDKDTTKIIPTVVITADAADATRTSITFTITSTDSEQVCYLIYESVDAEVPSADDILKEGRQVRSDKPSTITVDELESSTLYTVIAAAKAGEYMVASDPVEIRTLDEAPAPPQTNPEEPEPEPEPTPAPVITDEEATITFTSVKNFAQSDPKEVCLEVAYADDNNPDVVVEGTLYFTFSENPATTLPAGTYSVDNGEVSSKYGSSSYIRIWDYSTNKNIRYNFTTGTVTVSVEKNEDNKDIYTLAIDVNGENSSAMNPTPYHIICSYTGEITDMPEI